LANALSWPKTDEGNVQNEKTFSVILSCFLDYHSEHSRVVCPGSQTIYADTIEPDGRFYFHNTLPGEYVLSVELTFGNSRTRVFYPGVADRSKARRIVIRSGETGPSYDFEARVLPVVPISVVLDPVEGSDRFLWDLQLVDEDRFAATTRAEGTNTGILYGMRGRRYQLQLTGYPRYPMEDQACVSDSVSVIAGRRTAPLHIAARCPPKKR